MLYLQYKNYDPVVTLFRTEVEKGFFNITVICSPKRAFSYNAETLRT